MEIQIRKRGKIAKKNKQILKPGFYPQNFSPWGIFIYKKSTKSTIFRLLTVNHGQDLMPIKYKSLFKYKLHPISEQVAHPGLTCLFCLTPELDKVLVSLAHSCLGASLCLIRV